MHKQMMDNKSYNIIMALASNLEALEAYHKYSQDGNQQIWQQAIEHTEQVVQLLQQQLPQVLQQNQSQSQSQQQGYATQGQSNTGGSQYNSSNQPGMGSQYSAGSQSGMSNQPGMGNQSGMSGNQTNPRQQ